jgi:hypothetical protein
MKGLVAGRPKFYDKPKFFSFPLCFFALDPKIISQKCKMYKIVIDCSSNFRFILDLGKVYNYVINEPLNYRLAGD